MVAPMRYFRFLLPLLALGFIAAAKKPQLTIRFHSEANPVSGSEFTMQSKLPNSSRSICLSKIADISENDIVAVYPFPNNGSMGCAFKLDLHGRIALETLSQEHHGGMLFGFVNARVVTAMMIDRRISDGIIVIPQGLTPAEIVLMKKSFPTLGENKETARGKKNQASGTTPAPLPIPTTPNQPLPRGD